MTVSDHGDAGTRVSDAEREATVATLRGHFETGRLTFDEFNDRIDEAYAARTGADLLRALRELPRQPTPAGTAPAVRRRSRRRSRRRRQWRHALSPFVFVNGICVGVWAAAGAGYFWPVWVLIPIGAALVSGIVAVDHHGGDDAAYPVEAAPAPPEQRPALEPTFGRVLMSVLFVDIVDSTRRAAKLRDAGWRRVLDDYERNVDAALSRYGGDTLFTKGDEVVAGFALPAAAVECALRIRDDARALGLDIRAGVHAGEVDRVGNQANGIAMHIGRRVCEAAEPGQVLVSSTVQDLLVGSSLRFAPAGERELKGLEGQWRLFEPAD